MDLARLGQLADTLETVRSDRIAADKVAASLKAKENQLKQEIIQHMEENEISSVGGNSCVVNRSIKDRAISNSWPDVYKFIAEHDAFDLLEKRLRTPSVLARLDDGIQIPGIHVMEYSHLTYSKART